MSDFFFGPAFPAPGGGSISSSGETGEAGGQTRTYSELDFAAYDHIWWGLSGIGAAMDGAIDMASETFSLTSISGDGLIAIWSGTTSVSGAGYSGLVYEQLTVAINLGLSGSVSWSSATPLAFPAGSPAAVAELSALAGQLVVNLAFSASTTGAEGSYIPFFDFYENAHSFVASQEVRSSSERFITQIANQLPAGISGTISTDEDVSRPFTLSDFGFLDGNSRDSLKSVRIDTIPASGALTLNSENVAVGDEISATDIANGFLAFTPAGNACGLAYASFDFSVFDSLEFSISPATLTIDVTPVNDSPTEINLSASSLDENNLPTASVATLAAASPDAAGEFTFKLVSGEGSTDNAAFTISGDQLQINAVADFETKSNYDIRLRVTGLGDLWFETVKTITVNDLNEAPAAVTLSAFSLDENNAAGATVATLQAVDPDAGDSFTFVLFSDDGPDDNAAFTVSGDQLQIIVVADFETKSSYDIRLRVTDEGGMWFETIKTITVIDANDAPVDIQLSAFSLDENNAAGVSVATLTANDPGSVLNFTFVLVSVD